MLCVKVIFVWCFSKTLTRSCTRLVKGSPGESYIQFHFRSVP